MRVLMLGWEFPPHISGGLGTACFGLTRGLAHHDVDVLFVVPRAHGDEDTRFAHVLGAGDVVVDPASTGDAAPLASWEEVGLQPGGPVDRELALLAERMRVLAVDSALRPYMTPESYAEEVARLSAERSKAESQARAIASEMGSSTLPFTGSYGPDLMSEVARYARVVAELVGREPFDVVHAHDWMTFPAGILAARLAGRPLVVHLHASEYDRSGENVNTAVRDIEQLGMEAADRVICVSHYLASLVRRRYGIDPAKVRVVHNAVTHDEQVSGWHADKPIDEPIVLFLGRVTFQKGPDYFLEAAARVLAVEPNVKFVVSGSGDMLPRVVEQAAQLGIARNVHFTGFLRGKDVERMYAMADIYVMPSVSEPFGISPLEAMASDVPVIVSNQSGVSEVVRHALKVDFWDVQDIANKILALLRYPELRQQLTDEGRGEVMTQRWEVRGGMVRDIYEELVA
jgi:glycosyltransferase involved in cell wall biosynthesis